MADNPDFGLFGPPSDLAVYSIFYYFSYWAYLGYDDYR